MSEAVADHDAAFIGVALDVSPPLTTFRVEKVIKGPLGSEVSFRNQVLYDGFSKGERVGLVVDREDGAWDGGCGRVDPEILALIEEAGRPANDGGAPRFLLGGLLGEPQSQMLDSRGEVIRHGAGGGDSLELSVCPGSRYVVELVSRDSNGLDRLHRPVVAIRDLATFEIVRRVDLTRFPTVVGRMSASTEVSCRDRAADEVLLLAKGGDIHVRLLRLRDGVLSHVKTLDARDGTLASIGSVFFATGQGGRRLKRYDIESGRQTEITRISDSGLYIKSLVVNQDASKVAGLLWKPGRTKDTVFVAEVRSGRVVKAETQLVSGLQWVSGDRLVEAPGGFEEADLRTGHRTDRHVRVYDSSLKVLSTWRGWSGEHAVVVGETIYGLGAIRRSAPGRPGRIAGSTYTNALVSAPLGTGPERVIRELPDVYATDLKVLAGATPLRGAGSSPSALISTLGALAVATLGAILFVRKRRRASSGSET